MTQGMRKIGRKGERRDHFKEWRVGFIDFTVFVRLYVAIFPMKGHLYRIFFLWTFVVCSQGPCTVVSRGDIMSWLLSLVCRYDELADRIKEDSKALLSKAGLREYFDPMTGNGCGGHQFSWTAALCLAWLDRPAAIALGHKTTRPQK